MDRTRTSLIITAKFPVPKIALEFTSRLSHLICWAFLGTDRRVNQTLGCGPCAARYPCSRHPCKSFVKRRHGCSGRARESAQAYSSGMFSTQECLSASVPAFGRTRHPFAASSSEEPSQKIEFVFSASPETIRREPPECNLLRSVGNLQDLAVCALFIPFYLEAVLCCPSPAFFPRYEVSLLPIHGQQI